MERIGHWAGGSLAVWKVCERAMGVDLGGKLVVH